MPTIRRRTLAAELKLLRERAGLTPAEAAKRLDVSVRTVNRAERHGEVLLPKEAVLRGMLALYGADSATTARLAALRAEAKRHQRGWWVAYRDVLDDTYVRLEEAASQIDTWQPVVVPGLLQTEEYARALIEGIHPGDPDNPRRVEARVMRRTRFNGRQDSATLHAIIDESVLRRQVGDTDMMRDQISYLKTISRRSNVTVQIVPLGAGAHPGFAGPFVRLKFDEDDSETVYVESRAGELYPEDAPTLAGFNIDWGHIHGVALSPDESAEFLADLLEG